MAMISNHRYLTNKYALPMTERKPTVSVVFIGHVDAGKSTLSGRILLSLNMVDMRLLEKYKEESKSLNRESWYLSWLTDTGPEERIKGKTQETCSIILELPSNRINLLDTPGHKLYLTDMIRGANQADVAVLVISARTGEFESGFEKGGQTREHVILAKAGGVQHCVCVINKMDERGFCPRYFKDIVGKLDTFLRRIYKEVVYIPISGYEGVNVLYDGEFDALPVPRVNVTGSNYGEIDESDKQWYKGDSLLGYLNSIRIERPAGCTLLTVLEKERNVYLVKIESGSIAKNDSLFVLPAGHRAQISAIIDDDDAEQCSAHAGDIPRIRTGTDSIAVGDVLADTCEECTDVFTCQLTVLDCKSVISVGYRAVLHLRMSSTMVKVAGLQIRRGEKVYETKYVKRGEKVLGKLRVDRMMYVRPGDCFAVRDEDMTVAIGIVRKILR